MSFSREQINATHRSNHEARWKAYKIHTRTRTRKKRIIANRTRFLISIAQPIYHLELSNIFQSVTRSANTRDSTRLDVTLKILGNRAYIPSLIRLIKQDPLSTSLGSIYVSTPTHHRHESADNRSTTYRDISPPRGEQPPRNTHAIKKDPLENSRNGSRTKLVFYQGISRQIAGRILEQVAA